MSGQFKTGSTDNIMSATITIAPMALLEAKLVQKLEEKKREGWTIDPKIPFDIEGKRCCLLGAQLTQRFGAGGQIYRDQASELLGVPYDDVLNLEYGFLGDPEQSPFKQLGAKLRAQYVEAK
jgi:hypothetical protein